MRTLNKTIRINLYLPYNFEHRKNCRKLSQATSCEQNFSALAFKQKKYMLKFI